MGRDAIVAVEYEHIGHFVGVVAAKGITVLVHSTEESVIVRLVGTFGHHVQERRD